ncbi:membrane protein [Alicyclobacillus contaminans]|uniref:YhgE/Pip domain-containing protein n=1 Tax=Alicyclobacillus contaminans TaxID=392016 RepID=UPI000479EE68|nr:YhgE/Pip domain-containing protein [Alicyclobacillus contaminans]GMA50599.1 membrane protein [Alicyclobacillus contaminans]
MRLWTIFRVEWARLWGNKLRRVGLASMLVLPLLYSSLYLWAFWDPYGHLDKLPVAIVNEDAGGTQDGKAVNFGKDLQTSLLKDRSLDWHMVSASAASQGLHDGTYYMTLDIPKTFTEDILSVGTSHPRRANLDFESNPAKNYLAGQITSRVQGEIAASMAQNFSQTFIQRLLDVVGQSKSDMSRIVQAANQLAASSRQVADGANKVASASGQVASGSAQLNSGLHALAPGSTQVVNGLAQVQHGTAQVQQGMQQSTQALAKIRQQIQPVSSPAGQLVTGSKQLANGLDQFSTAVKQLNDGVQQASAGAKQIQDGAASEKTAVQSLQNGLAQALSLLQTYANDAGSNADPRVQQAISILGQTESGLQQLSDALNQTGEGAASLSSALSELQSGSQTLYANSQSLAQSASSLAFGMSQFQQGIAPLYTALGQVQSGLSRLQSGLTQVQHAQAQLQSGATAVSHGLAQSAAGSQTLANGASSLHQGAMQLASGAGQLANGQQTFAGKVSDAMNTANAEPNVSAYVMAHPIRPVSHSLFQVNQYGAGLAPYFIPLSLWVGALMLFFLVPMRDGRWRLSPVPYAEVVIGKLGVLWCIGIGQAVIAATVLRYGLGLTVTSNLLFYLYVVLLSLADITLIGWIITWLGTGPGRFLGIVLLLLQLTSSAGTFPLNLVPVFFHWVHPLLPMTYGVATLRNIIAIHDLPAIWQGMGITALYGLAPLLLMIGVPVGKPSVRRLKAEDTLVP